MPKSEPQIDYSIFDGKSILLTGGTGSFGQRFVRLVLEHAKPKRLVIFSRDELKQYEMQIAYGGNIPTCLRFFIGDVRDCGRLLLAMREIDIVVHAAALKHVSAAEYNPFECIRTNVLGAENIVRSALENNVDRVLALSTDKAVAPINLYGASKLASDKIFVAANNLSGSIGTRFSVVRYGNVVGSRGSVVPLFRSLIEKGEQFLPITNENMTRFWITLTQGVEFVASSIKMMAGGEVFVPKIPSVRITDLAECMAPDLPQKIVGIRPGEKIHEALIAEGDARMTVDLGDRYVVMPTHIYGTRARPNFDQEPVPVPENFEYSSDQNTEWLVGEDLAASLKSVS